MSTVLRVVALVLFLIAALLGFGWFDSHAAVGDVLGWLGLAGAAYVGSTLVP